MKRQRFKFKLLAFFLFALFALLGTYGMHSIALYGNRWFTYAKNPRVRAQKQNVVPGTICSVVSVCVVSPVSVSTQNPVLALPSAVSETVYSVLAESAKPPFSMETGVSPCVTCAVMLYCAPLMEDVPAETPTVNHAHESPQRHTRQSAAHKIGGSSIARSVSLRSRSAFERRGGRFLLRSVFFIWKLPSVETGSAGDGKWLTTGDSETIKRHGVHAP